MTIAEHNPHMNPGLIAGETVVQDIEKSTADVSYIGVITDADDIFQARFLTAERYLGEGYITEDDLDENGLMSEDVDPYVASSTYLGSFDEDGHIKATLRQISQDDIAELPTVKEFGLQENELLSSFDPRDVVEISGVSKVNGGGLIEQSKKIIEVYGAAMRHSVESGHKAWVMGTDSRLTKRLGVLFGSENFTRLGEQKEYLGSATDPILLDINDAIKTIIEDEEFSPAMREVFISHLKDINPENVDETIRPLLEKEGLLQGSESEKPRTLRERILRPEVIAKGGLVAYALARAMPVGALEQYGVNKWIFLGLDLVTIPPYVNGTSKMLRAKTTKDTVAGGAMAVGAFSAPYAYIGMAGAEMPMEPAVATIGYTGLFGILAVRSYIKAKRNISTETETA